MMQAAKTSELTPKQLAWYTAFGFLFWFLVALAWGALYNRAGDWNFGPVDVILGDGRIYHADYTWGFNHMMHIKAEGRVIWVPDEWPVTVTHKLNPTRS